MEHTVSKLEKMSFQMLKVYLVQHLKKCLLVSGDDKADIALVPIENSQAGRVADTQRLIPDSDLNIIGEYFLEVRHNLLAVPGTNINDIKRVHSHEQGIAQCRNKIIKLK